MHTFCSRIDDGDLAQIGAQSSTSRAALDRVARSLHEEAAQQPSRAAHGASHARRFNVESGAQRSANWPRFQHVKTILKNFRNLETSWKPFAAGGHK